MWLLKTQPPRFNFEDSKTPNSEFVLHEQIIEDRGSRYSVSVGRVQRRADIKLFLKQLKSNKKYAKATQNTWAARISQDGLIY
jgi:putative IMPACT (imprinted ancient) family translation regulator